MICTLALALASVSTPPTLAGNTSSAAAADAKPSTTADVSAGFWWEDYDKDGLPDAFAIGTDGKARLLRNQGDGSLADVTLLCGLDALGTASFAAWCDFDRDGAADLFVGSQASHGHLLRNAHDGTFQDVTEFVGLARAGRALEVQWLDYDLDGLSDLELRTDAGEELYHALPNGMFEAVELDLAPAPVTIASGDTSIEELDAAARESDGSDTSGGDKPVASRRPRVGGVLPPFSAPATTPTSPTWANTGGSTLNITTCIDQIKNQATSTCIAVSSAPTLGWLYPLTTNLNVSAVGNVGIGTTTPTFKLDIAGTARMSGTLTLNPGVDQALDVSTGSIYKSGALFIHTKGGLDNTALGRDALKNVTNGAENTAAGSGALSTNTIGGRNTAAGHRALFSNTTGSDNTASGARALFHNTSGLVNTASGSVALYYNTTGFENTASGSRALYSNTTGHGNTASGALALEYNTTGSTNTASGTRALESNTTGFDNTANGAEALRDNTIGIYNTASGRSALRANTTGKSNTAGGAFALLSNTTGSYNAASGTSALGANTTGSNNSATGYGALRANTTGNANTATGTRALELNTTARGNTASGAFSLQYNTGGYYNTASGLGALKQNTIGAQNTACGARALELNTNGFRNTASGYAALGYNTGGIHNTASGADALRLNTIGNYNTANGAKALRTNTIGHFNTASGYAALKRNSSGASNTACGAGALYWNFSGAANTAVGFSALYYNTTGSHNIAIGDNAGANLTTGSNNISIGNAGSSGQSGNIRIGTSGTQTRTLIAGIRGVTTSNANAIPVLIDSAGQLGTVSSSRRFKKNIRDMGDATAKLLALRPVTFDYKQEQTLPDGSTVPPEYGLIAEEVAEIFPDLVVYDDEGKPFTVKYHMLSAMLLNEMKKQDERFKTELAAQAETHAREMKALQGRLETVESFMASIAERTGLPTDGR